MSMLPGEMDWKIIALSSACHRKAVTEISILLVLIRGLRKHQAGLGNLYVCYIQLLAGWPLKIRLSSLALKSNMYAVGEPLTSHAAFDHSSMARELR